MHYLAACAIYLNEASYLEEWIEFHRLVGVEKFFLYDHLSTDNHDEVLKPYVDEGTVVVKEWPDEPGQPSAFHDCLAKHREEARWIAFIDLDEFLFSPTLAPLPQILADYEEHPGVVVNWALFGPSGHETKPPGLVLENYNLRARDDVRFHQEVKSVVDPRRAVRVCNGINPHCFEYTDGASAVDELFRPLDRHPRSTTDTVSFDRLRLNHYFVKSREQWNAKLAVPSPQNGEVRTDLWPPYERLIKGMSVVKDETIQAYLPDLRAALAARRGGGAAGDQATARSGSAPSAQIT
jgi:hypothetical protein